MAKAQLKPGAPEAPVGTDLLSADWFAALSVYWVTRSRDERCEVLDIVSLGMEAKTPEQSIYLVQQALRRIGLMEVQIIKLVLAVYVDHVQKGMPQPARQIAAEVLNTLLTIERERWPSRHHLRRSRPCEAAAAGEQ